MKYVIAQLDFYGKHNGYWTEIYNKDNGTLQGKILTDIKECDAKIYNNYEDAISNCKTISNNCDLLLEVIPYYDETSIYNNKNDYRDLQRIVSKYSVEDIAKVIHYSLKKSAKNSPNL